MVAVIIVLLYAALSQAIGIQPPVNLRAIVLTPRSVRVTWDQSLSSGVTGYLVSYTTTASYTSDGSVIVNGGSTTSHTLANLEEDTAYTITIQATNNSGMSVNSNEVTVTTYTDVPSAPPQNVMLTSVNPASLRASWRIPLQIHRNGPITAYAIRYTRVGSTDTMLESVTNSGTTYTISKLVAFVEYSVSVAAVNFNGTGPFSDPLVLRSGEDGFAAPTNVMASVLTPHSIEVTWSQSPNVTGYLVSYTTTASYTSGGSVTVNSGSTTSTVLTNLEENTLYAITVQATSNDNRMSVNSSEVSVITYADVPSSPPQNIMVTSVDPASLRVSWELPLERDRNGPITAYVIQYTRVESSDMTIVMVNNRTTHTTISELVAYVDYSVIVGAINVNGTGPFSDAVVGRSGEDIPSEPYSLEMNFVNSNSVTLQWSIPEMPNGIITQYSVYFDETDIPDFGNNVLNMLMGTVEGLSPDTVYMLQLRAHTRVGAGPPSNLTVVTYPGPVTDVSVINGSITSSALTLQWIEINVTNSAIRHYTVFYLPVKDSYGPIMALNKRKRQSTQAGELTMNFSGTTGNLNNLHGAVTYRIQVGVVVLLNEQEATSDRSAAVEITTLEGIPTAPRNLHYMDVTDTDVTLIWSRPDPPNGLITQYNVSFIARNSQDEVFYNSTILEAADSCSCIELSYTWTDLNQGEYQFSIVAFTSRGPGEVASVMLSTVSKPGVDDSSDGNEVTIVLATLLAIAVIGLVISVVINVFFIVQHKHSRYDVTQRSIRYSEVRESVSRGYVNTSIDSTNRKHVKASEPEYDDVAFNPKPEYENITLDHDVKMDANPAYEMHSHEVKMDTDPAYQTVVQK